MAQPVKMGYDENGAISFVKLTDSGGTNLGTGVDSSDAMGTSPAALKVLAIQELYNGATFDRQRGSNGLAKYRTVAMAGTSGSVGAWTPAAGKKFRLLGFLISADVAGKYQLTDGASGAIIDVFLNANDTESITLPPNGILSALANNSLVIGYPAVTGNVSLTALGTEE